MELPEDQEIEMNPITRKDGDVEALRATISKKQRAVTPAESVEVDPRLVTFKADFDQDAALQSRCPWAEIQNRLLANGGHYLALAQAMEQGGELFGVDTEGNPLISDRGDEPIMKRMNYKMTRDRVLYKHNKYTKEGKMMIGEDRQPISTGYEMFPYVEPYKKSTEISQYEAHTGKPFVTSPNGDECRSSWAESGENPSQPRSVDFNPLDGLTSSVGNGRSQAEAPARGVRRLLRLKKV